MIRCINVDWLVLYGSLNSIEEIDIGLEKYNLIRTENLRGTNNFATWCSIRSKKSQEKYAELCYNPYSIKDNGGGGVFSANDCTIQLCNKWLYSPGGIQSFLNVCSSIGFRYKSISKIDICLDFQKFDNNMNPQTLIKGFFSCKYWKVGQTSCSSFQKQSTGMEFSGIYFGSPSSAAKIRLYNKSQEMRELKEKPYIRDVWKECNLDENKDVWRLEVSIKPSGQNMVQVTTGNILSLYPKDIISRNALHDIYFCYINHYFRFRINNGKTLKKYAKPLLLFNTEKTTETYKPMRLTESLNSGRTEKLIIKRLLEMIENEKVSEKAGKSIRETIIEVSRLYRINTLDLIREKKREKN